MALIPEMQCECKGLHEDVFEGMENVTLENIVPGLVSLAGWETCSSCVQAMYSNHQDVDDFSVLYKLSYTLKKVGCIDGAIAFANQCLKLLAEKVELFDTLTRRISAGVLICPFRNHSGTIESVTRCTTCFGKLRYSNPQRLHHMILFFQNCQESSSNQEKLAVLKLTIEGLINEIDDFYDECTVYTVICFPYITQNAELAELVWSKLFDYPDAEGQFEDMLAGKASWEEFEDIEILYKAIALSPLATKRFYEFIQDGRVIMTPYSLECCTFHLTMAELEPSLANPQELQSFLTVFKGMDMSLLTQVANGIAHHNRYIRNPFVPGISETIILALLDCLPTSDLANMLTQETDDFNDVLYCYVKLGNDDSILALVSTLEETFLGESSDDLDTEIDGLLLLRTWLTCLKVKLEEKESDHFVIAYHTSRFLSLYLHVHCGFLPYQVDAYDFAGLMDLLTWEFLEKILIIMYEKECQRTRKCLKADPRLWNMSQVFAELLIADPQMPKIILELDPERIVKLVCCIFWLASQRINEELVRLVKSLPFPKMRYCLSLFLLSTEELQICAISSSYAFLALQSIIRTCIDHLFTTDAAFAGSWSRRDATVVGHPEVAVFYESAERSKSFGPFETTHEVQQFADCATKDLPWADYVINKDEESYCCQITKLYPVLVDNACDKAIVAVCQRLLRKSCNELLPPKSPINDLTKLEKGTICLSSQLTALHKTC